MSTALTFFFKEIFPDVESWLEFFKEYDIASLESDQDQSFARHMFKIIYRRFHNSNVQYDTQDAFKCDLANIIEDCFAKYKKQVEIAQKLYDMSENDILELSSTLANSGNNPNTQPNDPKKPLDYFGAQVFSFVKSGKLVGYLTALQSIPTKMIGAVLTDCAGLFKRIIPNQIYLFEGVEIHEDN